MKRFILTQRLTGAGIADMSTFEALSCLYDVSDRIDLLDLKVGEGFKDTDGDQWERTA